MTQASQRAWNDNYEANDLPWDTGVVDPHLQAHVDGGLLSPGRLLEIGCGTGTNAVWLAERGFDVAAVDLAPLAVERAQHRAASAGVTIRAATVDFLHELPPTGPYDVAFDRGCFHCFDHPTDRARFAARLADQLVPGGLWLSLIGSTEGAPRDFGPPRRSARDITEALERHFSINALRLSTFDLSFHQVEPLAWVLLAQKR